MRLISILFLMLVISLSALAQNRPPNVIVILVDDMGYNDVGCFGSFLIKTPHLDQMAKEGMRFTDFYANAPVCTPSRAALLTACYPQRVGMMRFVGKGHGDQVRHVIYSDSKEGLNPKEVIIPQILKPRGYVTACIGKWHLGHEKMFLPTHHGFDYYFGIPYSNDMKPLIYLRGDEKAAEEVDINTITQTYTREALKFIDENKSRPFFLYLAHNMPHTPLGASENFKGKSAGGLYGDAVEELDWSVGQVLDELKKDGIDENTFVVFTSDNGPWHIRGEAGGNAFPLRAGKGSTYEGGTRMPCIMRYPGVIPAGSECHEIAAMFDVMPTIAKFAGAAMPTDRVIDGKDISGLLADPKSKSPHEYLLYYGDGKLNAVRMGKWKLKLETALFEETYYDKIDNPDTKIPMKLYNLAVDPGEQKSVYKDHPDVVAEIRKIAQSARKDLGDERYHVTGENVRPQGVAE